MDRSTELRLPTLAVAVRLPVIGHEPEDAAGFVPDMPRDGRSMLIDHPAATLDSEAGFVAVRAAGRVCLLGAHAINKTDLVGVTEQEPWQS